MFARVEYLHTALKSDQRDTHF